MQITTIVCHILYNLSFHNTVHSLEEKYNTQTKRCQNETDTTQQYVTISSTICVTDLDPVWYRTSELVAFFS